MNLVLLTFILLLGGSFSEQKIKEFENSASILETLIKKVDQLEHQNYELNERLEKQEKKSILQDDFEERLGHVEEVSKLKTPRTCYELWEHGVKTSADYFLDPDGELIGNPPILAYCDFEKGTTEIRHDKEFEIKVEKCDSGPGCAKYEINYSANMAQIQSLIQLSETCSQSIRFGCFLAPLKFEGVSFGWWLDKNSDPRYYFSGDHPDDHICSCGKFISYITVLE